MRWPAPGISEEDALRAAAKHVKEKFGSGGYGLRAAYFPGTVRQLKEMAAPIVDASDRDDVELLRALKGGIGSTQ